MRKILSILLIATLVFSYSSPIVYSQEITPSDSPVVTDAPTDTPIVTESPTTVPTDTPIVTVEPTPVIDLSPTDAPTISDSPSSTIEPSLSISDIPTIGDAPTGSSSNDVQAKDAQKDASANTTSGGTTNQSTGDAKTQTGDAVATADLNNSINSTLINSDVYQQTINMFVNYDGDLDLSNPARMITQIVTDHPSDPVINVSLIGVDNYTYLTNNVDVKGNTGDNTTTASGNAEIKTGNASALVSVFNQVNIVVINSVIHIITVNIFGDLNGNIILPDINSTNKTGSISVKLFNDASLTNNASGSARTGSNTLTANGGGIDTGDAMSVINLLNVVNLDVSNANLMGLYINVLGTWTGKFLGLGDLNSSGDSASLSIDNLSGHPNCITDCTKVDIRNFAVVKNNIITDANTGGNNADGLTGFIKTGKAFSVISLINFINSYFSNSFSFFGIFNIFGNWHGDIGQKSAFSKPTPATPDSIQFNDASGSATTNDGKREDGGLLSLGMTNNIGKYIIAGDTITLFINGKNIGTGTVYDSTLNIHILHNGIDLGDPTFSIGELGVGRSFNMTTGLVIPKFFEGGNYTIHAELTGTTGENTQVNAVIDNDFIIHANDELITDLNSISTGSKPSNQTLVRSLNNQNIVKDSSNNNDEKGLILLGMVILGYLLLRFRKYALGESQL